MALLGSKTRNQILVTELEIATRFFERGRGLLGRQSLSANQALWIHRCNSIHTFFMKFSIDCVFVDKKMKITSIHQQISPWRLVLPEWKASSVIEMKAGMAKQLNLQIGEELYVGN